MAKSESRATKVRRVSREDFYKLEGLLTLAAQHNRDLRTLELAAAEITGEPDDGYGYFGITTDAVWSLDDRTATQLLNDLKIKVESGGRDGG